MKKVVCLIIAIVFLLLPLSALCADGPIEEFGDFRYRVRGEDFVIWYAGSDSVVVFPNEVNGNLVTRCSGVASGNNDVTSVIIPEGIMEIGARAFYGCKNLTSIVIHEGVERIGAKAFNGCTNLTSITLPESLVEIGDGAFEYCWVLTSITIPEGVKTIGNDAFSNCTNLITANIENNLIGDAMFFGCKSLTTLNIGENVTNVGISAFTSCTSLTTVTIPENVEKIERSAFEACTNLTSVIFMSPNTEFQENYGGELGMGAFIMETFHYTNNLASVYAFRNTRAQSYALEKDISFIPIANVVLNGEKLKFDVPAIIENDRVLVPMRGIFEALGAEVGWEGETSTVTAQTSDTFLSLQIGNTQMQLGSETVTLDVPAQIVLDRTVVPVRAVSEGLNATVDWNEETQTVVINTR